MNTISTPYFKLFKLPQEQEEYLYGCFLNYKDSLYLGRSLDGLLKLNRSLQVDTPIDQRLTDYASSCLRMIFPGIKIPGWTDKEFSDLLANESKNKNLSEDELMDEIEKDSEDIRMKIESGELDIWDDTPKYIDRADCQNFIDQAVSTLKAKVVPACNPEASLIEAFTKKVVTLLTNDSDNREKKHYQAILNLWDSARMFHEGEPPFKLVFSPCVAEQLGIDPLMESIRHTGIKPLDPKGYSAKKLKASLSVCISSEHMSPELIQISKELFGKIEFGK